MRSAGAIQHAAAALLVGLAIHLAGGAARADPPAAQLAISRARELGLARTAPWRRLLLYRRRSGGRWASEVDGADFFLAAGGNADPAAELEATLLAFFVPQTRGQEDKHALCKFPARRIWLESQLQFMGTLLAPPRCPALDRFTTEMDAESATVVFAANLVENPASAFGHTLLRIRKKSAATIAAGPAIASSAASDQRDTGIDYTAEVDTQNPLLYAFKGVTGLFPGMFRFRSYDAMLREYGASASRDLWEYELALTSGELELLIMHLWELTNTRIDYLYVTENCSYQIIAALDAAAPRLRLVDSVKAAVLPIDTVKAVHETPGLVRSIVYRPSVRSLFRASLAKLDGRGRDLVASLVVDADAPLPPDLPPAVAALVLETATLALDARHAKAMIDGRSPAVLAARERLVARRAAVAAPFVPTMTIAPREKEPHKSHGSMRFMLGTGMTSQYGTGFSTIGYRLAFHDLADPPDGQPELLQLQFLDGRIRYDHARRKLSLDTVTFAELMSLHPLSRFEKRVSWRARAFGTRLHDRAAPDVFGHGLDASVGGAIGSEDDRVLFFLMADAYVAFSGHLDGIGGSFVRVGAGPIGGLRLHLPARTMAVVTGSLSYLPAQSLDATFDVRAIVRTELGRNVAMGFEGAVQPLAVELQLASYLYF